MNSVSAETYYLLHELVGEGGMGVVHRGTMVGKAGERTVAIKRIRAGGIDTETARRRLLSEGRLVFQLTHANVCQVVDVAAEGDALFLVMEYVEGLDLHSLVTRCAEAGERVALSCAVYVAREVARALDYAHRRRDHEGKRLFLSHGDVSPRNILLSMEGEVKLADFGIARTLGEISPGRGVRGGTPGFVAPEVKSSAPDHRSDIYSLGASLYFALSGKPASPVPDSSTLREAAADGGARLVDTLSRMLRRDPAERYGSSREVERDLAMILAQRFPTFTPSDLAASVARCRPRSSRRSEVRGQLTSIAAAGFPEDLASREFQSSGTRTAFPRRPVGRHRALLASLLAAAIAGGAFALHDRTGEDETTALHGVATPPRKRLATDTKSPSAESVGSEAIEPSSNEHDARPSPLSPLATDDSPSTRAERRLRKHVPGKRHTTTQHSKTDEPPPERARPPEKENGRITITSRPWGAVYIDGQRVSPETPLIDYELPAGHRRVRIFFPTRGDYSRPKTVVIEPGRTANVSFEP